MDMERNFFDGYNHIRVLPSDGFGFEKSVRFRFTKVGAGFGSDIAHLFRFGFG